MGIGTAEAGPVKYDLDTLRGDLFGGLTSAVVALPVSLAFGVASGLGAAAGLYGAIAVGFFASVFGGTRSQISGPTAPMAVAMAVIITSHSSNLGRSPDRGDDGRAAAGAAGGVAVRPLRGLYAARGGVRLHVRHRRHRHADPDAAVPGRADRTRRTARCAPRPAGCAGEHQRQRLCHRPGDAHRGRAVAAALDPVHAGAADGADRRHAARCPGAARRAGDRAGADRAAAVAARAAVCRIPGECHPAGPDSGAARLRRQPAHFTGGRLADGHAPQRRPRVGRAGASATWWRD